jgi:2,4-dienoyl-CoA reductase-like NADH-dependent reductase (Old Yellow Enzyme family)
MYSCEQRDGVVGDWHLVHLGSRAMGGAGLVIAEASAVNPEGRISPWCPGIWSNNQVPGWKRVADFIRQAGAASAIQLAHAGRKASVYRSWSGTGSVPIPAGGWSAYSATDEAFTGYEAPRKLATEEIPKLVQDYRVAAALAMESGFDALEIHAAHGYLLHQFLSPLTNRRDDQYGGELENRARFLLEIVEAIREEIGAAPLLIRFSATDYVEGGWDQAQTNQVASWAHERGADMFDLSSGGLVMGVKIPTGPGYQVQFSESTKRATGARVSSVGQITEAQQAEAIVASGRADVVMMGRQLLRDPYFPLRAAHELGVEVPWPEQYTRGKWPNV